MSAERLKVTRLRNTSSTTRTPSTTSTPTCPRCGCHNRLVGNRKFTSGHGHYIQAWTQSRNIKLLYCSN
ncbi:hypothetical protein MTO96_047719 [Rhipicephalus appendiculatus]